jgi:hypothetical protein
LVISPMVEDPMRSQHFLVLTCMATHIAQL